MSYRKCPSCKGSGKHPLHPFQADSQPTECVRCGGKGRVYQSRMVSARELVGRKIVGFDPGAFADPPRGVAHRPTIHLDDGSHLYFSVEETEHGAEYGVFVGRSRG